jgi:hypothetical protein
MRAFSSAFCSAFAAVYSLCYVALLALELPLIVYYPLEGVWTLTPAEEDLGPAMTWYGLALLAAAPAALAGAIAAARGLPARLEAAAAWVPLPAMVACAALMHEFFVPHAG